jgi:hypothetical protein
MTNLPNNQHSAKSKKCWETSFKKASIKEARGKMDKAEIWEDRVALEDKVVLEVKVDMAKVALVDKDLEDKADKEDLGVKVLMVKAATEVKDGRDNLETLITNQMKT